MLEQEHRTLTDVYYIPQLCSSIISIGQLDERGSEVLIKDGVLRIRDREQRLLAKVKRSLNRLYLLDLRAECWRYDLEAIIEMML